MFSLLVFFIAKMRNNPNSWISGLETESKPFSFAFVFLLNKIIKCFLRWIIERWEI